MSNDQEFWKMLIDGVKPLPTSVKHQIQERPKPKPVKVRLTLPVVLEPRMPQLPELTCGGTADIDRNLCRRMDRGEYQIDAQLDLHHLTAEQAHNKLCSFIGSGYAAGMRMVLVVTGRGKGSEDGRGIICDLVPRWLNNQDLRHKIVRFCYAAPSDGGQGALYILLRRHRP